MKLLNPIRDWLRGYSDEDVISVCRKVSNHPDFPGAIIPVSEREMRALVKKWISVDNAQCILKQYEGK